MKIKKFLGGKTDEMLTRILWVAGGLVLVMVIISAVVQKRASVATEVLIHVEPLSDGSRLITPDNVLSTIARSIGRNPQGTPIEELDLERMEVKVLERDPFIADADVYIDARSRLNVDIRQRQPVLRIIDGSGKSYYLDKDGKYMPISVNFTARIPVATGYISPFTPEFLETRQHILKDLFHLAEKIREDEFMSALAEQIFVDKNKKFAIIPKVGRQKILLGRYRDMEDKFRRLKIFYKESMPYEGWQKYRTINLEYDGQVVCKRR
jgi:cell division protein FtsQ